MLLRRGASFVISLILARLLYPEDYGLIGMAMVFVKLIGVVCEAGISDAIIQMKDEKIVDAHYHSTFWASTGWSLLLFFLIYFLGAESIAEFYGEPKLDILVKVLSVPFLFSPYNAVARAKLTRDFSFKELATINIVATVVAGGAGILAALSDAGVWSLAVYSIVPALFSLPLYWYFSHYRPSIIFDVQSLKDIVGFGSKTMGANITNTFIGQIDYLLVSKILSKYALGIYTFAFTITDMIRSQIMQIINKVMLPGYSKIQHDNGKLRQVYGKVVLYNALVIYPIMGVLFVFCDPLIQVLFGEKWIDSVPIVKILCGATFFHMLVNSNTTLIRGKGYAGLEFGLQLFKGFCIFLPSVYLGLIYFGVNGAAYAVMLNRLLAIPLAYYVLYRIIGLNPMDILESLYGLLFAFGVAMGVGYFSMVMLPGNWALLGVPLMLTVYGVISYHFYWDDIKSNIIKTGITLPGSAW